MSDGGKGSARRPMSIADEEWNSRWDAIFGRDKLTERAQRERALDELSRINQELGLYDEPELPESKEPSTES